MMVADVLSSTTSEIGSKVLGHITEYGFLVAGSALYAIALLVILPKSGIRLFPARTRLTKWYGWGIMATFALFAGWSARDDLSFADAALVATAIYLALGALFPAVYVVRKWREEDKSRELEASVNVWAILAIVLAFQFGFLGTWLNAADNKAKEAAAKEVEARLQESERLRTEQSKAIEALQTGLRAEKEDRARMDTTQSAQLKTMDDALQHLTPSKEVEARLQESERLRTEQSKAIEALQTGLRAEKEDRARMDTTQLTRLDGIAADERQFRENMSAQLKTMDHALQHLKPSGAPPRNKGRTVRHKAQGRVNRTEIRQPTPAVEALT